MSLKNDQKEGELTKSVEKETSKLPSQVFLAGALSSMALSLILKACGSKNTALFVGQWASPFLLLGIYNKIVKVQGHDKDDDPQD